MVWTANSIIRPDATIKQLYETRYQTANSIIRPDAIIKQLYETKYKSNETRYDHQLTLIAA